MEPQTGKLPGDVGYSIFIRICLLLSAPIARPGKRKTKRFWSLAYSDGIRRNPPGGITGFPQWPRSRIRG